VGESCLTLNIKECGFVGGKVNEKWQASWAARAVEGSGMQTLILCLNVE
jgi:hypothetical protein